MLSSSRRFMSNISKHTTPVCAKSLDKWLDEDVHRRKTFNYINPTLFDVTLRDGIQGITNNEVKKFNILKKKHVFYEILYKHNPARFEIGSLVNPKVLPIFKDTIDLYKNLTLKNIHFDNLYILVPNEKQLGLGIHHSMQNYSFITSVSDAFQLKNTRKGINDTKEEMNSMIDKINEPGENRKDVNIKLYVSCINECPIVGKIDNDYIIKELHRYAYGRRFNEVCLSDTCGTLQFDDFKYIIDNCIFTGVDPDKLSLHLHCSSDYNDNTENIIHYALDNGINKFDVSIMTTGGCSVTISKEKLKSNLTYELFYKYLCSYINKNINRNVRSSLY